MSSTEVARSAAECASQSGFRVQEKKWWDSIWVEGGAGGEGGEGGEGR